MGSKKVSLQIRALPTKTSDFDAWLNALIALVNVSATWLNGHQWASNMGGLNIERRGTTSQCLDCASTTGHA
eukprot:1169947-Amphidinium_carterae.2